MAPEDLNDEDLIAAIKYKCELYERLYKKYSLMLDACGYYEVAANGTVSDIKINGQTGRINGTAKVDPLPPITKENGKKTFESVILEIFEEDKRPHLTRELIEKYEVKTGIKISRKDFSSKLSIRSKNGKIKNVGFPEFPTDKRYWWGLSEFFDGDNFKPEYQKMVKGNNPQQKNLSLGMLTALQSAQQKKPSVVADGT